MELIRDISAALPEIVMALWAMTLLMIGVFFRDVSARTISWAAVIGLAFTIFVVLAGNVETAFNGQYIADEFAEFAKVLVLVGAAFVLIISSGYNERENLDRFELPVLLMFAVLGMQVMVSANDLISLYLGIELQSLALYIVAAIRRDNLRSSEAGLKYFVLGALSSGILLYGITLVYGFTGTTGFSDLAVIIGSSVRVDTLPPIGIVVGLVFIISGLAFKVSAVPFHMWTPDVYEGAPTPVTSFFAVAPKIAAIALFARVLVGPFGDMIAQWQQVIVAISVASMALGAFAAIGQTNIKRLMAYSSIGHMGFALVGLAAGSPAGVQAVLVYMSIYLFMNVGTFACILAMRRQGRMVEDIADLAGLSRTNLPMAIALAIFMFSMAGIPPLAGFFGKLFVFMAAIEAGLVVLAVIGLLTSVVGAYYYIRIIKLMFFDEAAEPFDKPVSRELSIVITIAAVVTLLFLVGLSPVYEGAGTAAASLFRL
ncbi:MAG: NADH-quinone oxidoreductase subunit NuoN [Alphaproteobacteria bacterium]|nr:NADH-quinone oxidoreductase subunit NuoN [Alphaproteobacteria bacterium]